VPLGITIELPDWAPPEAAQVLRLSRYDAGCAEKSSTHRRSTRPPSDAPELPIRVRPLRTERAHKTSPDGCCTPRHNGTYALAAHDAQIAGSVWVDGFWSAVVMCAWPILAEFD
jgi:hypothetical protein